MQSAVETKLFMNTNCETLRKPVADLNPGSAPESFLKLQTRETNR